MITFSAIRPGLAVSALLFCAAGCDPEEEPSGEVTGSTPAGSSSSGGASGSESSDGDAGSTGGPGPGTSSDDGGADSSGSASVSGGSSGDSSGDSGGASASGDSGGATSTTGSCEPAAGEWVDCDAGEDCGNPDAACLELPQSTGSTCVFTPNEGAGCIDVCDCPAAPETGDAVVACGDPEGDGGADGCYLDCSGGATCPDGQTCVADSVCGWPSASTGGVHEPCNPPEFLCDEGSVCIIDGIPSTIGVCVQQLCGTVDDCPAGPAGSNVACADIAPFYPGNECHLACAVDGDCPVGASCYENTLCVWPAPV